MLFHILFLLFCISGGSCLYFHLGETERKCFIEEIPDETMVVGECDSLCRVTYWYRLEGTRILVLFTHVAIRSRKT